MKLITLPITFTVTVLKSAPPSISCFFNYSEFGHHGYCVAFVTNTCLNLILRFDWRYHHGGSSTSTICYGYQTLTVSEGAALPD